MSPASSSIPPKPPIQNGRPDLGPGFHSPAADAAELAIPPVARSPRIVAAEEPIISRLVVLARCIAEPFGCVLTEGLR